MTIAMSEPAAPIDGDAALRAEERALVDQVLAGDEAAMEALADGYFPGLYRFALARLRGDTELTREIVQSTVVKALSKLGSYRGEGPLFGWLSACCRNEIGMHFRRSKRSPRLVELDEGRSEAHPSPGWEPRELPEETLARREAAGLVHAALDHLPPRYASALEWKYLERLPVKEIAGRLELSAKAAESLLTRARRAFREGFERLTREGGMAPVVSMMERRLEP